MKILYVLDVYPILSETFIRDEIEELQSQGHEIIITSFNHSNDMPNLPQNLSPQTILNKSSLKKTTAFIYLLKKIKRISYAFEQKQIPIKEILFHSVKISKIAIEHNVDHIHSHFGLNAASFAIQSSKLTGLPCSFTVHGYDVNKVNLDMIPKIRNATTIISISEFLKEEIIRKNKINKSLADKIKVIPFGVKTSKKAKEKERNEKFLFVGRFNKVKGIEHLVNIWKKDRTMKKLDLIGFGSEAEENELRNEINENKLNIEILGRRNSDEIYNAMSEYKAIILPFQINKKTGERDTGAIVAKEAMLNQIPIITTDLIKNIITENEAYIAIQNNETSLYEKIKEYNNSNNDLVNEKINNASKKLKNDFSIEKQIKGFIKCIQS